MDKPIFYMLIGLPGSGKSTWAEQYKNTPGRNIVIHSSDAIREEISGDVNDQSRNHMIFKILHSRVKNSLLKGIDVIYDATNINSNRRREFLKELKNIECSKQCIVFATPYEKCLINNLNRDRKVPDAVIKRMYMNWNTPGFFEGWDKILINHGNGTVNIKEQFKKTIGFDQDNHHHTMTLDKHMLATRDYFIQNKIPICEELSQAALYHDCGKIFVQDYHNAKGESTVEAHYYQHENVGAYDCLCDPTQKLLTSLLINLHMRPYTWTVDKTKEKYRNIWGNKLFNMVMLLHEADRNAH